MKRTDSVTCVRAGRTLESRYSRLKHDLQALSNGESVALATRCHCVHRERASTRERREGERAGTRKATGT